MQHFLLLFAAPFAVLFLFSLLHTIVDAMVRSVWQRRITQDAACRASSR